MAHAAPAEPVTPNRVGSGAAENGEFRRTASARLHRNKRNYPEMCPTGSPAGDQGQEDTKKKEQVRITMFLSTPLPHGNRVIFQKIPNFSQKNTNSMVTS